jgi:L-methionine (R)-S-oxide reductase
MHVIQADPSLSKSGTYREIGVQLSGLFSGERNGLANTANMCALLYQMLPDVNWVGFYFLHGGELVLGPFQGKVACVRIPLARGVCGTAAARRQTLVVPDVNEFPGHIACDAASRSEIVVPLLQKGRLLGVLDLDSPNLSRFDHEDREGLESATHLLLESSMLEKLYDEAVLK